MSVQTLIQVRRGTSSEWSLTNPTLSAGEWGYETNTGRYKIGDGLTAWNSLRYSSLLPKSGDIVGSNGINVTFAATTGVPVTISVTGIQSSQINDFNTAVSGLISAAAVSPSQVMDIVSTGLVSGNNIGLTYNSGTSKLTVAVTGLTIGTNVQAYDTGLQSISDLTTSSNNYLYTTGSDTYTTGIITSFGRNLIDDSDAATARSTLGLGSIVTYNSGDYSLSGHTHTSSSITDFNSSVSGLIDGIYAPLNSPAFTGTPTAPTAAADTNTTQIANTAFVLGQASSSNPIIDGSSTPGSSLKYARADHVHPTDTTRAALSGAVFTGSVTIPNGSGNFSSLNVNNTAVSIDGHTHIWSNINDASTKATLNELAYLSGVVAGTASSSRALVVDSNKDITGIRAVTTAGDVTVGGNLTVKGITTTVESTTVNIGDNIIRVNTSGLNTGGFEVYTGIDYKQLVWNTSNDRWEFTGQNVYTSGFFIGSLSGNANTVTNGVYTTDTGTVTSTMIANGTIVNDDINSSAAIAVTKLASSGVTIGSTTINLGQTTTSINGLTSISGTSAGSPTTLYYCVIDGGTP